MTHLDDIGSLWACSSEDSMRAIKGMLFTGDTSVFAQIFFQVELSWDRSNIGYLLQRDVREA